MNADKKMEDRNLAAAKLGHSKLPSLYDELGSFSQRLQQLIGGKSARSFAIEMGISTSTFHQYVKGQSEPTRPVLSVIADKTNVNIEWLVTGKGPMHKTDSSLAQIQTDQPSFMIKNLEGRQVEFKPSPNLCHLPILDLRASCGLGAAIASEAVQAVFSATASWIRRELGANPEDLSLIFADGDSMADTIKPEEIVIIDRSKKERPGDGIWVFLYDEGLFIKRLQFMPGKQIKVKSDNPHYETYTLSPDDTFQLLGRVVAALPLRRL